MYRKIRSHIKEYQRKFGKKILDKKKKNIKLDFKDIKKILFIRYDGKKIYPYNVENILLKCPIVKSVAVVGIPDPNHYNGEVPVAFVSIDDSYSKEEAMKIISDYANNTITDYLIPTSYYIEDELPKTVVGKVDKKVLKKTIY